MRARTTSKRVHRVVHLPFELNVAISVACRMEVGTAVQVQQAGFVAQWRVPMAERHSLTRREWFALIRRQLESMLGSEVPSEWLFLMASQPANEVTDG